MEVVLFAGNRMLLATTLLLLVMDELLQTQIRIGEEGEGGQEVWGNRPWFMAHPFCRRTWAVAMEDGVLNGVTV
jgi:hypothetical protein